MKNIEAARSEQKNRQFSEKTIAFGNTKGLSEF